MRMSTRSKDSYIYVFLGRWVTILAGRRKIRTLPIYGFYARATASGIFMPAKRAMKFPYNLGDIKMCSQRYTLMILQLTSIGTFKNPRLSNQSYTVSILSRDNSLGVHLRCPSASGPRLPIVRH